MFDIGFMEMTLVGIVALLVLGPERLPVAVRKTGLWVSKIKRTINRFSQEINQQLKNDELNQVLKDTKESLSFDSPPMNNNQIDNEDKTPVLFK